MISKSVYSPFQIDELHRHNQNLVGTLHKGVPTVVYRHGNCCKWEHYGFGSVPVSGRRDGDVKFSCSQGEKEKLNSRIADDKKYSPGTRSPFYSKTILLKNYYGSRTTKFSSVFGRIFFKILLVPNSLFLSLQTQYFQQNLPHFLTSHQFHAFRHNIPSTITLL